MPERGGPTTESGILYQNTVAALHLGRLLDALPRRERDRVVAVRVEAPTEVDDTVVTFADDHRAYIQAKENIRGGDTAWNGLWRAVAEQFQESVFQRDKDRLVLHLGEIHDEHHALRELCQRTGGSQSYAEWWHRLTKEQQGLLSEIRPLVGQAGTSDDALLSLCRHIDVEIVPLTELERTRVPHWMPASATTAPHTLFRLLRDRVGGEARVRGTFTADQLRQDLETENGVVLATAPSIAQFREAVRACGSLLRQHKHTLGDTGRHLPRGAVDDIVAWASGTGDVQRMALLLDDAGMGKTVVMHDVLHALEGSGIAVLAIKADQQLSGIAALGDLPARLHLPDSVERVVGALAAVGPLVVLIDQIDALSLSLAHDQQALDVALDLLARLRAGSRVPILISCRRFDRHTDPRLQRMVADREFAVQELATDDVCTVLQDLGLDYEGLSPATRHLLRIPLHLDLFTRLPWGRATGPRDAQGITTLQDLYALLWRDIVLSPAPGSPPAAERVEVLRRLTAYMDGARKTAAPRSLFTTPETAPLDRAVRWLASAGILVESATQWTFLHQTFFDYCYARHFVEEGGELAAAILAGDQGLFARPQLLQVISYLRSHDQSAYLRELSTLVTAPGLRTHLRDLLMRWFGALAAPTDDEWTLARRWLSTPALRPRMLLAMEGNPAWFARVRGPVLEGLLALEDEEVDTQVLPYVASLLGTAQGDIVATMGPRLGRSERWTNRVIWLLARIRTEHTPEALDLMVRALRLAPRTRNTLISNLDNIAATSPEGACRLLGVALDQILDAHEAARAEERARRAHEEADEPRLVHLSLGSALTDLGGGMIDTAIGVMAAAEPRAFLTTILPWLERAVDSPVPGPLYYAYDDLAHGWHSAVYAVQERLLSSLVTALASLARTDAQEFRRAAARLAAFPARTPQYLLAMAYQAVPNLYADDALSFLLADRRRLNLGEHEQFETRQLISAIYPFLSTDQRNVLEDHIITATRVWKAWRSQDLQWSGLDTLHLLQAIPGGPTTERGTRTLRELERKFPGRKAAPARITMQGGWVGPPISLDAAAQMPDQAWLRAMRRYHGPVRHRDFLKGGANELAAGALRSEVKAHPERFHRLALRVPDDVNAAYVEAFLMGLADADAPADLVSDVVRHFGARGDPGLPATVARTLEQYVEIGLPGDLIALLDGYVHEEGWQTREDEKDPYSAYFGSDRGAAFQALMRVLHHQGTAEARARRWDLLEYLATSTSTALRAGAIEWLLYTLHEERERVLTLFEAMMEGHPSLLRAHYTQEFLYHSIYQHFARMVPFIRALMQEEDDDHLQRGAELACIAALSLDILGSPAARETARELEQEVLAGRVAWRRGAARIYSHNLDHDTSGVSEHGLRALLDDEDETVRRLTGEAFPRLRGDHVMRLRSFLETYASSRSAHDGLHQFTEYLWEHGLLDPTWSLAVVNAIVDNPTVQHGMAWSTSGEKLVRLVLRVYTDPTADKLTRTRAMDAFDRLMEQGRYTGVAQQALSEWDRR